MKYDDHIETPPDTWAEQVPPALPESIRTIFEWSGTAVCVEFIGHRFLPPLDDEPIIVEVK